MNKFLPLIFFVFTTNAFASSLPNCPTNKLSMNGQFEDECISTCTAVGQEPNAQLSVGSSGFCVGSAKTSRFTLLSVRLGQSNSSEPSCDLWSGNLVVDKGIFSSGEQISAGGTFNSCKPGIYDVVYLKKRREEIISGEATFPDGSGKVARTTNIFGSTLPSSIDPQNFLETSTSHSNNSLPYVRPSVGWNLSFIKLSQTPSDVDLNPAPSYEMIYDWATSFSTGIPGPLAGYECENNASNICARVVDNMHHEERIVMNSASSDFLFAPDGGLVVTDAMQPSWSLSYFALNNGAERGLRFLWHNDAGVVKYLGVNAGDPGLQIRLSLIDISGAQ
jgi:hypothetical protein